MSGIELPPHIAQQDKGPTVLITCSTLTAISTVFVVARLYTRSRILNRIGLDDCLIIISMICGHITLGFTIAGVRSGNGRHFVYLTDEQKRKVILYTDAAFCPGVFSFGIPKLAVVALLTRITNPSQKHKIILWSMTSGCLLILFGCVIILFAQCSPARSQWDFSVQGTCWSPWILIYYSIAAGSISAAVDLYLAIYPALILFKLQMNIRRKLGLSAALGLGAVATIVAIFKCTQLPALASADFSYDTSNITMWTSIEGNAITIAACIPTLQPLFEVLFGRRTFGSSAEKGSHGKAYDSSRNKGGYRNGYGSSSAGLKTPRSVELSTIGGGKDPHCWSSNHRKMGVSDLTTLGKDSQESILGPEDFENHDRGIDSEGWIRRTHEVSVVFEDPDVDDPKKERRGV